MPPSHPTPQHNTPTQAFPAPRLCVQCRLLKGPPDGPHDHHHQQHAAPEAEAGTGTGGLGEELGHLRQRLLLGVAPWVQASGAALHVV